MSTILAADLRPWHRIPGRAPVLYAYPSGRSAGGTVAVFRDRDWAIFPAGATVAASFGPVVVPADFPDDVPLSAEAVSAWEWRQYLELGVRNGHDWARRALEVAS